MKLTLSWLKDHLETDADAETIAEALTMLGLEVEGVEDRAKALAAFTVGYVREAKPHPDADRLRVCTVETAKGVFDVVCGAPNARTGMKGAFAEVGAYIPGSGMTLKKSRIRGVESNGMLCSERELGLSDEHEGIIDLPEDAPVGAPVAEVLGLADPLLDVNVTPNRSDCAGVRGLARELAARGLGTLRPLDTSPVPGAFPSPIEWRRDFADGTGDACPFVVGRSFRGVTNGPSPQWVQDRLRAIGLRPISALVDITNLVTFDLARPLHVFDIAKLSGAALTMRLARPGETIGALDGRSYTLDGEMTVIADAAGPQAIGGVMGGESTGVSEQTTEVFLEVALFDPVRTAMTGRKLGIVSDARYRFERGVDPTSALWGAEVAARLILEICGGEASALTMAGEEPDWRWSLDLRTERIATLGGLAVAEDEAVRILAALGFEPKPDGAGRIRVSVPPWRPDILGEADLVEEVLRVHGYDDIPVMPLDRADTISRPALDPRQIRAEHARRALAARGLVEAVTYSFMPRAEAEPFGGARPELVLVNPISADLDAMRPSILPNLLAAAQRNTARGLADVPLFEVGPAYEGDEPKAQRLVAAGVRVGASGPRHWAEKPRPVDAIDAKADAIEALEAAGAPVQSLQVGTDAPAWYHPGRSGALRLGPNALAWFGEVHPALLERYDLRGPVAAFEVLLDAIPAPKGKRGAARKLLRLPPFQPVERDFAFEMARDVPAETVLRAAAGADKALIADVALFDVYEGENVAPGNKSVAIAVTLQPTEATLTDAEIEAVSKKVVDAVTRATGGTLRG